MCCIKTPAKLCSILYRKCKFLHCITFVVVLALTRCDVSSYLYVFVFRLHNALPMRKTLLYFSRSARTNSVFVCWSFVNNTPVRRL